MISFLFTVLILFINIGDEGSAFWIAMETIKIIYKHDDSFALAPYSTEYLKKELFEYFKIKDLFGILEHLYPQSGKIDKAFIARFCVGSVIKGCLEGDLLSMHIMKNAGIVLGKHVKALIPTMENELLLESNASGLKIICVGSVWKSWEFLREGFLEGIRPITDEEKTLKKICLLRLKESAKASLGAAAWASKKSGDRQAMIHLDYSNMSDVFFQYEF